MHTSMQYLLLELDLRNSKLSFTQLWDSHKIRYFKFGCFFSELGKLGKLSFVQRCIKPVHLRIQGS